MQSLRFLSSLLLATSLAVPAFAQIQVFGGNGERAASTKIFWDNGPVGMVCVQYGQPEWKDEYDSMLPKLKGKQHRLGKDFWTTFNTSVPVTIGQTKVEPGSYYLGLKVDADGGFHLLVLDAKNSDKQGWAPFIADAWKADYTVAMTKGETDTVAEKLAIELAAAGDDVTNMTFRIHWGMHTVTAPFVAHLATKKVPAKGTAEDASGKKNG